MIEDEVARRVEQLVAKRVEEELERRKEEIEAEVLRRIEEAKQAMEKQMLEELERQRQAELEAQAIKEVKFFRVLSALASCCFEMERSPKEFHLSPLQFSEWKCIMSDELYPSSLPRLETFNLISCIFLYFLSKFTSHEQ